MLFSVGFLREKMEDLLKTIGNTPLLRLRETEKLFGLESPLYAKAEFFNPTGSVKDRTALYILQSAKKQGLIKKGDYIVEATSGNMGISLSVIGKKSGYKPVIVIPDGFSAERTALLKAYGVKVFITDKTLGMDGAVKKAKELSASLNGYYIDQFNNENNYLAHYFSTGAEIYRQLKGSVGQFIACVGSGGTITGVGKYLKEKTSAKIIAVEPEKSPLLSRGKVGKHKIQGIGTNFLPSVLDKSLLDVVLTVSDEDAYLYTKKLANVEGLLCGLSSGACYKAAIEYLKNSRNIEGNTVVLFADGGLKYISEGVFAAND